ncbi:Calx-beta domain-containing protein [Flavobacterium psychrophilum]|uniref:Calx-beta domain-containing protein n=2 Tax=Flavobacterium psychrophilum TaxID=96345 RepID=UPI003984B66E
MIKKMLLKDCFTSFFSKIPCFIFVLVLFLVQNAHAQCTAPVGCASTDFSNYGANSTNVAATIEYDNYSSCFHATIVRTPDGLKVWGQGMDNNGSDLVSPKLINATNFPALGSSTPLKGALGSGFNKNNQGILLSTNGLYAWGTEGVVLDASITSSTTFQKITIAGNTNGLPAGVTPADVKMMFATYQSLVLTTCAGNVWVLAQDGSGSENVACRGNGDTFVVQSGNGTSWSKVTTSAAGNPDLTGVVSCRGSATNLIALTSSGKVYVWGKYVYLGDGSATNYHTGRATQMTLPGGITPKMIGSTNDNSVMGATFYVLDTNGKLYSLGNNHKFQLGISSVGESMTWVRPIYPNGATMDNIKWISPQEHDSSFSSINVINSNYNLYAFGADDRHSIAGNVNGFTMPIIPPGLSTSNKILAVETGGHTSMVVDKCETDFGYIGHRIGGSMANGSTEDIELASYTFNTTAVKICGAESDGDIIPVMPGVDGSYSNYCSVPSIILTTTPAGGTLSLVSGPATLSGNTLNFTGPGTVVVKYAYTTSCGVLKEVSKTFTVFGTPVTPTVSSQVFCIGEGKKVSDLVATGTGIKWYNAATGGTQYTGTELLVTGTYYASQTANYPVGACESARTVVAVTVSATPAPTALAQTFCKGDVKKVSDLVAIGTGIKWYDAVTAGTQYTGAEVLATGTYYASQTINGCESARTAVAVTVNSTPGLPTASAQTFCSVDAKKVSDLVAIGTGIKWYNAVTAGTQYTGAEVLATGTYYASQTINGCESARTAVAVKVNSTPGLPTASAQTFCSVDAKKVSDLVAIGTGIKWYNAVTAGVQYTGTEVLGTGIYYASQTTNGCESLRTAVSVTVSGPIPQKVSGTNTVCVGNTTTFSATTSGGAWTSATPAVATVNSSTGVVTGVSGGVSVINYSVTTTGGCVNTGSRTVTVSAAPNAGTLSGPQGVCVSSTTAFSSTVSGGAWSSANTAIATVSAVTGEITGVSAGTTTITYTVAGTGGCSDAIATRDVTVYSPTVTLSGTTSILENSVGINITATLSTATISTTTITLAYSGTATNGVDYTASSATITIPAGATTGTVTIIPIDDNINEGSETVIADITNVTGGCASELGVQSATVTITDNDSAPTVATISPASATEGSPVVFNFTLSNPSAIATSYTFTLTNGTAGNLDYTTTSVTVIVPAGAIGGEVIVPTTPDTIDEPNETFTIQTGTLSAIGTILDDDNAPDITIGDATIVEGGELIFPVSLSNPSSTTITLTLGFTNVTTSNGDYTTTPVVVTFLAGATTATVTVQTTDDAIAESTETFTVGVTTSTGIVGSTTDTGIGTITDNDSAPTVAKISPASATEGSPVVFNFTLSNPSAIATSYIFTLTNGTAGNLDYTTTSVTVIVPAGAIGGTVSVPTTQDTIDEPNETFTIHNGSVSATGTILDDDNTPVATIGNVTINEGAGTVTIPVSIDVVSSVDTVINITTATGTAGTSDYTTTVTTVTIPAGQTTVNVTVPILEDTIDEPAETFTVNGTVTSGNTINTNPTGTVTITDNDATPVATIGNVTINEGAGTVTIPVSIDVVSSVDTVINITTATGTAGTSDYTTTVTTVTIPAGQTTVNVTVPILEDTIDEPAETFTVNGTVTSGNTINTNPTGTVTITDNDATPVATIGNVTINEGAGTVTIPVSIDVVSSVDTVINITTATGTAGTSDYTTTVTTVTIPAGQTTVNVTVPILEDTIDEPAETFTVNGTVTSGNTINTNPTGTVTITDNDATPVATIGNVTINEGAGTVTVPVSIDVVSSVDTVINITTATGTAGTSDYTTTVTTVTIPAGQTTVNVTVPILEDTIDEPAETFTVNGTVTSGNTINTNPTGTVTITDNDATPVATIGNVTINEGAGTVTVPVSIDVVSSVDTVINITTATGTAGTSDYTTTVTTVTIPAGQTTVNVTVPILEDTIDEPAETFTVNGTVTSGNTINTNPTGTVTITDNDATPVATIGNVTINEGAGTVTIPVSIDVVSSVDTVINITTATGTAGTSDYTTTVTTVTIPAGQTTVNVTVPILEDTIDEPAETFTVNGTVTSGNTINTNPTGTVTITDNDATPVATIGNVTINEGAGTVTIPVSIDVVSSVDTVINITTATGTAGTSDYTTTVTTVTIPAGQTTVNVTVPILEDTIDEPAETFTVNGTVTSGNTINTNPTGTVTITDNDATPVATIGNVTINEGAGTVTIPVSIDVVSSVDTVINITTATGTAGTSDYTTTVTTVTIPAGQTTVNVTVPILEDTIDEPAETFTVNGTVTSGNTINTNPTGTVTITDNDATPVATIGNVTINEGAGTVTIPVSIDVVSSVDTVINITTATGTAGTSDYTTTVTTVTIPAGQTTVNVTVPILEDTIDEPAETFTVNGTVTSGNTINTNPTGTVTITDNDATPVATIGNVTINEGAGTVTIPVSIDVVSSVDTVINITTATGTAGTSDYTTTVTTVTIPAGQTTVNVTVPILEDTIDEPAETFTVNGTVTSGNTINTNPTGTVTITDNDATPVATIGNVTINEGAGTVTIPVSIDVVSSVDTVINITTATGTAGTSDYTTTVTTVTIPAGQTTVNVTVPILEDTIDEPAETFTVNGTVTSGNTINTNPTGTVTITDNDATPVATIGNVTINEGAGTVTIPVSIDVVSSVDTVINITTATGTAGTSDYTTTVTTVTIPAGQTTVNVTVPILEDTIDEPAETFTVNGTVTSGNTINTNPTGTVTITDNDATPVATIGNVTINEGAGTVTIPVSIDVVSSVDTVINITTATGTAGTSDYTTTVTTVTIPAGQTTVNVTVPILEDTIDEPAETFTVNGTVTSGNTINTNPTGTVTITDNDATPVATIGNVTINEGAGTVTIPVSIDVVSSVDTVINITTATGTAGTSDYTTTVTTVTIPAGQTTVNVTVPILEDTIDEPAETFTVNGTVTSGNTINTNPTGTVTITDNDATPVATIGNVTINEGAGTVTIPVSIDVVSSVDTVINITTATGTAGTSDYTTTVTTVTIPAGQTTVNVTVPILEDTIDEPAETFTVNGTVTSGNTINTNPTGTVTITDNDATPVATIGNVTINEGAGTVTIPVSIDVVSSVDTVINITTATGTAGTSDYTTTVTTVTIPAGQTTVNVTVPILEDTIDEPAETFTVNGTVTSGNTINTNPTGTVTITDNDATPVATIGNVTINEGAGTVTIPVSIDVVSSVDTVINITTATGTAGTSDYTTTVTTVTIPAGQTTVNVTVPILEDTIDEPAETFTVNGTVTSGNTINTNPTGTVTITDNDATPVATIGNVTINEGAGTVTVPVSIDVVSSVDTVINITTATGTAGTSDYTTTVTTVTIPAGQTTVNVTVPILEDTIDEPAETFTVNGTVTSGNTINTNPTGTVTITDNDATPVATIGNVTINEGAGTVTIPVSIDVVSSVDTVINITTATGTAGTSDYTTTVTTVTIPAGQTTVNVTVPILEDTIDEPAETFTVNGTVTSGNTINTNPTGTVTITDNDATPVATIGNVTINEGAGTVTIPVSIDVVSSVDTVINITTATGTAGTSDYTTTVTTVTIPAGQTTVNVTVPILEDTIDEPAETFTVNGTVTSGNTINTNPTGTVTITDNDATPVATIGNVTINEGAGTVTIPVSIDVVSSVDTVINITTATGTAGTSDYTTTVTTVTIPAGQTTVNVTVPILEDTIDEPAETFTVNGTVTSGNTINTNPTGTVTITDNDATPVATIGNVTINEGAGTVTVPVSIDVVSSVDTVINITTATGTAGTSDYTTTVTTVTIPAGQTTVNVTVPILEDTIDEPAETFTVNGTVTSGNTINTNPTGTVTITDNDATLIVAVDDVYQPQTPSTTVAIVVGNVTANDTLNGVIVTGTNTNVTPVTAGPLSIDANGVLTLLPNTISGNYTITYTICEVDQVTGIAVNPPNCSTATVTIEVLPSNVIIYNGVTPNGDGDNDVFYLENIEFMKESSVEIYNRWGVLVYEVSGYDNKEKSFKGISEGRVTLERGSLLPVGTYYYIVRYVDLKNESIEKAGYLHLTR